VAIRSFAPVAARVRAIWPSPRVAGRPIIEEMIVLEGRTTMTTSHDTDLLEVSDAAVAKALALLTEQSAAGRPLRVFAQDGGCSGYQFGMAIADEAAAEDIVIERGGLTFLVDAQSAPLVRGAQIDFVDDVMRSGFTITNPNLASSGGHQCTCGAGGGHGGDFEERCC
jgi:iron-sulfur cluster assembly accessory protein